MIKKQNNKIQKIKTLFSLCLVISMLCIPNVANAAQRNNSGLNTQVTITDLETGEITQYDLDDSVVDVNVTEDENGTKMITNTYEVDGKSIPVAVPYIDMSKSDIFSGWKGVVNITYTDNGTYACLKGVNASWKRVDVAQQISNKSLDYGQDLVSNPRSGYTNMTGNSIAFSTLWPQGKYGSGIGNSVGATLNAKIGSKYVAISCNATF